jgi:UDP-N-acetylmuramyl tripeptide synthase
MKLVDSRRLTGPNLYASSPGVIAEIACDDPPRAIALVRAELARMLDALGIATEVHTRVFGAGAEIFFTAGVDVLLPATEVNEWAIESAASLLAGGPASPLEPARATLAAAIDAARRPGLLALLAAARTHQVPVLIDDEQISLGYGPHSTSYPAGELPDPASVAWSTLGTIPIALVTGTNGKTTTTRLVTRIARLAGLHVGNTSSDGIAVDEQLVLRGDWSGPDAARIVLRRPDIDIAVLEVARGGILRRGLAVEACDAALITNVSDDHLESYGVDDVATMARVKAVVARGARTVVLNAGDPELVALASTLPSRIVWFGGAGDAEPIASHVAAGGDAWYLRAGQIIHARGASTHTIAAIADVPITFGGKARYNVDNALAAAALAAACGLPETAIVRGLHEFTSSRADNPGRGNLVDVAGVTFLIDFGHNPAAVRGVLELARTLVGSGRLFVGVGLAGDRPDEEIVAVARELAVARPAHVFVHDLEGYLRGRAAGAIPDLLTRALGDVPATITTSEVASVRAAIAIAHAGDLVLILAHTDDAALDVLYERDASTRREVKEE